MKLILGVVCGVIGILGFIALVGGLGLHLFDVIDFTPKWMLRLAYLSAVFISVGGFLLDEQKEKSGEKP